MQKKGKNNVILHNEYELYTDYETITVILHLRFEYHTGGGCS
jgi:hypothetical protein